MRNSLVRWALPRKEHYAADLRCRFCCAGHRAHQGISLQAIQMEHLSETWPGGDHYRRAGKQLPLFVGARRSWRRAWRIGMGRRSFSPFHITPQWIAIGVAAGLLAIDFVDCDFLPDHAVAVCILPFPDSQHKGDWAGMAALSGSGFAIFLAEHCCGNLLHGSSWYWLRFRSRPGSGGYSRRINKAPTSILVFSWLLFCPSFRSLFCS